MSTLTNDNCLTNGLDLEVLNLEALDDENEEIWLYQSPNPIYTKIGRNNQVNHFLKNDVLSQRFQIDILRENEDSVDEKESQYDSLLSNSSSNYEFDQYLKHKLKSVADVESLAKQQEESLCQSLEYLTPFQSPPHKINTISVPPSKLVSTYFTPPRSKINTHSSLTDPKNLQFIKQSDFNNLQYYLQREDVSRTNSSCESESAFYSAGSEVSLNDSQRISSTSRNSSRKASRKSIPLLKSKLYDSSTLKRTPLLVPADKKTVIALKLTPESRKSLYKIDETDSSRIPIKNGPGPGLKIGQAQGSITLSNSPTKQGGGYSLKKKSFYPSALCLSNDSAERRANSTASTNHTSPFPTGLQTSPSPKFATGSMANLNHYPPAKVTSLANGNLTSAQNFITANNAPYKTCSNERLSLGSLNLRQQSPLVQPSVTPLNPAINQIPASNPLAQAQSQPGNNGKTASKIPGPRYSGIPRPPGFAAGRKLVQGPNRHSSFNPSSLANPDF